MTDLDLLVDAGHRVADAMVRHSSIGNEVTEAMLERRGKALWLWAYGRGGLTGGGLNALRPSSSVSAVYTMPRAIAALTEIDPSAARQNQKDLSDVSTILSVTRDQVLNLDLSCAHDQLTRASV